MVKQVGRGADCYERHRAFLRTFISVNHNTDVKRQPLSEQSDKIFRANQVGFPGTFQEGQNIGTGSVPVNAFEFVREHSSPVTRKKLRALPTGLRQGRVEESQIRFRPGLVGQIPYEVV
jgi:hypothetical protein